MIQFSVSVVGCDHSKATTDPSKVSGMEQCTELKLKQLTEIQKNKTLG